MLWQTRRHSWGAAWFERTVMALPVFGKLPSEDNGLKTSGRLKTFAQLLRPVGVLQLAAHHGSIVLPVGGRIQSLLCRHWRLQFRAPCTSTTMDKLYV